MNSFCCTLCREVIVCLIVCLRQGEEKETATLRGVMIVSSSIWEVILHHFEFFNRAIIFRIVPVIPLQYFIQTQPVNQAADQVTKRFSGSLGNYLDIHGSHSFPIGEVHIMCLILSTTQWARIICADFYRVILTLRLQWRNGRPRTAG